jgi:hypothetical protein
LGPLPRLESLKKISLDEKDEAGSLDKLFDTSGKTLKQLEIMNVKGELPRALFRDDLPLKKLKIY